MIIGAAKHDASTSSCGSTIGFSPRAGKRGRLADDAEIADHPFTHVKRFVPGVVWRFFDRRNITFKEMAHASEQAGRGGRTRGMAG